MYGYCAWDLETTIKQSFKRKANPFDPDNFIVANGYKFKGEQVVGEYFGRMGKRPFGWFTGMLDKTKLLVGMNIKFDLLHALREPQNYEAWQRWVVNGGRVWDIQIAEYLLRGMEQTSHMMSLDDLAAAHGGTLKIDEVKALWEAGICTADIDRDLLMRYLIGDDTGMGDIGNTELIFLSQLDQARKSGQVKSIMMNCLALLCTVEMERNGMFVDKALGLELAAKVKQELEDTQARLAQYLPDGIPFDFNWGSPVQKSALIFGGTVQYDDREYLLEDGSTILIRDYEKLDPCQRHGYQLTYPMKEELHYVLEDGGTYECSYYDLEYNAGTPDLPVRSMFKTGKNAGEYKTKKVKVPDTSRPKARNCKAPYSFAGYTAPSSEWQGAQPGVYSTSADVIEELGNRDIPFLKDLARSTSLAKDLGTYYITVDERGNEKGMLTLVQPDSIIHHMLNMCSTVTARLSSSNPNLQNIPKGKKSDVKLIFKSRFANGWICQSDFTALEIYIQAILTGCRQLIADLLAGLDLHCVRVSQKEGISYEEAYNRCKNELHEGGVWYKEWDSKRTDAKVFSFQRAYGAGVKKISDSTGIPIEDVEALVEAELERYPEIEPFFLVVKDVIEKSRIPTSTFVQHPNLRNVTCQLGKGYYRTPDNKRYSYREQPSPEYLAKRGVFQSFSPTEIKNYIVQGSGGEWAKAAMCLALLLFYKHRNFDNLALLVNQVHDAIYGDFEDSVKVKAAAALHAAMEEASTYMEWYFGWHIPVPVPSDTTIGRTMKDEDKIHDPSFPELVKQFKHELRQTIMAGYIPSFDKE